MGHRIRLIHAHYLEALSLQDIIFVLSPLLSHTIKHSFMSITQYRLTESETLFCWWGNSGTGGESDLLSHILHLCMLFVYLLEM